MTTPYSGEAGQKQSLGGGVLRDTVYAAHDGIITTFAVVAGVVGADLSAGIVLVLGIANLIADGISMGAGNFLGLRSEQAFITNELKIKEEEIKKNPERERAKIRAAYREKGFEGDVLERIVHTLCEDKERWAHAMLHETLDLSHPENIRPLRNASFTFSSFLLAGAVPLIAYFVPQFGDIRFGASIIFTAAALLSVGALRTIVMRGNVLRNALEILFVGSLAGMAAYAIGFALRAIVHVT